MKLPAPTAEFGIGPTGGTYVTATQDNGSLAPAARWSLRPQMTKFDNLAEAANEAWEALPLLERQRAELRPKCNDDQVPCWGADGTDRELNYVCCYTELQQCGVKESGAPMCKPIDKAK
jgi:hypothetical protein